MNALGHPPVTNPTTHMPVMHAPPSHALWAVMPHAGTHLCMWLGEVIQVNECSLDGLRTVRVRVRVRVRYS